MGSDVDAASDCWTDASSVASSVAKGRRKKKNTAKARWGSLALPKSKKEILDVFTLSRTNQILQGHSPTAIDSLSPREIARTAVKGKWAKLRETRLTEDDSKPSNGWERLKSKRRTRQAERRLLTAEAKRWMDLVTSELFSATVSVTPKPAEFNAHLVPTDPRRGRLGTVKEKQYTFLSEHQTHLYEYVSIKLSKHINSGTSHLQCYKFRILGVGTNFKT